MLRPVAAEDLFVSGFRPADKLVWDGSKFAVAPAGQMAYMRHPQTGRRMMVAEPTATKMVPYNSAFSASHGWTFQATGLIEPCDPLLPGGEPYRMTGTNTGAALYKTVGVHPPNQTAMCIARNPNGSGVSSLRMQSLGETLSMSGVSYNWATGEMTIAGITSPVGNVQRMGSLSLAADTVLIWFTMETLPELQGLGRRILFYYDTSGEHNPAELHYIDIEHSPYWTSPIVTEATALTRAADVLMINDYDSKVIGSDSSGTFYVEAAYPLGIRTDNSTFYATEIRASNISESIIYSSGLVGGSVVDFRSIMRADNVALTAISPSYPYPYGAVVKGAASMSQDALVVAGDGLSSVRENTGGLPVGIHRLSLSATVGPVARPMWFLKIARDKKVRTTAELEAMTS